MKRLLFLATLLILLSSNLNSSAIFAVGGVEPRLMWRNLAGLPAEIHFMQVEQQWEISLREKMDLGEKVIVACWGPDSLKVIKRLNENQLYPDWLVLINPGCIELPKKLQVAKFPQLFKIAFPIIGKWWISTFIEWGYRPRKPEERILASYIFYWSKYPEKISNLFNCKEKLKRKYREKSVILLTSDLVNFKMLQPFLPLRVIITLKGAGLFPQEVMPFYVNGIFSAILKRRIR